MFALGCLQELGNWDQVQKELDFSPLAVKALEKQALATPVRLHRGVWTEEWLVEKYGEQVRPWKIKIKVSYKDLVKGPLKYTYLLKRGHQILWETEPREVNFGDPAEYPLSDNLQIVNSSLSLKDSNFRAPLTISRVALDIEGFGSLNFGACPMKQEDF